MSRLAPGRTADIEMLLDRKSKAIPYSHDWNHLSSRIDDLVEEGRCETTHRLRHRLLGAARAQDASEQIKISYQIDNHIKKHHPMRFKRAWVRKVK